MQAETSYAVTLRSRPLFPFQAVTLGAAIVAGAALVAVQFGGWRAAHQDETPVTAQIARADHPFGALVFFDTEPQPSPARIPSSSLARGTFLGITPDDEVPVAQAPPVPRQEATQAEASVAPLPPPRPQNVADLAQQDSSRARRDAQAAAATPAPDNRGLFERIFNIQPQDKTVLAYAAPQDGEVGGALRGATQMPMGYADGMTAVYDISAKTVFMPNGEKLEAHSGLGPLLDDPSRVHVKNRGATPPNVYDLSLRESLFHGVRALRLNPVNASDMFGRDGMLAHTYMLGPNGDSNGCVSFKDYERFLNAYLNGQVKRLIVVQRRA